MDKRFFVGRERELARLQSLLDQVIAGHGGVIFIAGEAGIGKTELIREFAYRAQTRTPRLIVAIGECNFLTGLGDAYLPFKGIMRLLSGDVEDKLAEKVIDTENAKRLQKLFSTSAEILVELGPDLIDIFVPGSGLVTRAGAFLARKAGWTEKLEKMTLRHKARRDLDQSQLFEQYGRVLERLAASHPLLLLLDDLQWADGSSLELLFHLGRRIPDARILVVGTYRPEDVALGRNGKRHPLELVVNELKRYYGDIVIDLTPAHATEEGQRFVEMLIETEANLLSRDFKALLFKHTKGHPLFTVELLRYFQDTGILTRDATGRWLQTRPIVLDELPARVEAVLEERVERLAPELQEILSCASVIGQTFAAQVLAKVAGIDERQLLQRLTRELVRHLRLLEESGVTEIERRRLYNFAFRHILLQQHIYSDLTGFERELLHRDTGLCLEELYGESADEIAVQLAWHFLEAHEDEKAIEYLEKAGNRAREEFSNESALEHYTRLLSVLETQEETCETLRKRLEILKVMGGIYKHTGAYDSATGKYNQSLVLAKELRDDLEAGYALDNLADVHALRGEYAKAHELYEEVHKVAIRIDDKGLYMEVLNDLADLLYWIAVKKQAVGSFEEANELLAEMEEYSKTIISLEQEREDFWALSRAHKNLGNIYTLRKEYAQAIEQYETVLSIALAHDLGKRALNNLGETYRIMGEVDKAVEHYEQYLEWALEVGARRCEVKACNNLGASFLEKGAYEKALAFLDQSLELNEFVGWTFGAIESWIWRGLVFEKQGKTEEALESYRHSLKLKGESHDQLEVAEILKRTGLELYARGEYPNVSHFLRSYRAIKPSAEDAAEMEKLIVYCEGE